MTGWEQFAERLAEQLTRLPADAVVTIGGDRPSGEYVQSQVVQLEDSVWGEFLGDALLGDAVIDAASEVMTGVGWQPPGNSDHGKNWWIEISWPIPSAVYRRFATMIVTGFRDYHRLPDPSALSYHAWKDKGQPIELHLDLPRLESAHRAAEPGSPQLSEGSGQVPWTKLEPDEIMSLAAKLVSLDPAWRFNPHLVAEEFGWPIRQVAPDLFQLDTGPGTAKGYLFGADGETKGLEVPVSMPVPDNDELRLGYVFTLLTPTLDVALGKSALPPSTRPEEVTWGSDIYRLNLVRMPSDIRLFLTHRH